MNMSHIRSTNSRPEEIVRKHLFSKGFRYRKNVRSLPGTPDIVLPKYKTVIFVNGCFWHKHDCSRFVWPSSNQEYWIPKIQHNVERDKKNIEALNILGCTRDLTALHHDKCSCGRTLVRMDRILGRSDDMLIIRGVNVFPTQIESVILEMEEFEPHYLLIVGRENNTDTMELQVEVRPEFYSDEINKMLALKKKLGGRLQSVLGLGVNVKLVEPRSIERSVGKAKRVIDNRKI